MNQAYLMLFGAVMAVGMTVTGLAVLRAVRREERIRLRIAGTISDVRPDAGLQKPSSLTLINLFLQGVTTFGTRVAASGILSRKVVEELEKSLQVAGLSGRRALGVFLGGKVLLLVLLPIVALLVVQNFEIEGPIGSLLPAAAGIAGLVIPDMTVKKMRAAYLKSIEAGLPDTLDMLLICSQSGLPLEPALARVRDEIGSAHPRIAWELTQTLSEMQMNSDSRIALNNWGTRTDLECIKRLTTTLIQTMQYGTPISEALRTLSAEMRNDTLIRFEEKAARLPVLLTLPMVAFVLPCIFIVVAGPAAIRLLEAFK